MNTPFSRLLAALAISIAVLPASASTTPALQAVFSSPTHVPVTASSYTATGKTVNFTLNFAPPAGTALTVINNIGQDFVHGTFDNLAQGQAVDLEYKGAIYRFVASYHGGTGNDLVLLWAHTVPMAWGANNNGELGNNTLADSALPVPVDMSGVLAGKTVTALSTGSNHSLALCADGTLAAWGGNPFGALGNNTTADSAVPVLVSPGMLAGKTVIAISAGGDHSMALCSDGTVAAWGDNGEGILGNGDEQQYSALAPVMVDTSGVLAGKEVVAVSTALTHSLALCSDGTAVSWGANDEGQLGDGSKTSSPKPVLVKRTGVLAGKTVIAISAGMAYSLALCSDGTVAAWGNNLTGQLGNNSMAGSTVPVRVNNSGVLAGKRVVAIAAGDYVSVALCSDGTVATWGGVTSDGLLGSSRFQSPVPIAVNRNGVLAGKKIVSVATGSVHSQALCADGTLASWGLGWSGQLGNGSLTASLLPVLVSTAGRPAASRIILAAAAPSASHCLALIALPSSTGPQIAVEQTSGTPLLSGGSAVDIGNPVLGTSTSATFTIKSTGIAPLSISSVTIDGANVSDFAITSTPATSLAVGATTTLVVTFAPDTAAGRTAVLHIASNDPDTAVFSINLTGAGAVAATFNAVTDVPFTASGFTAGSGVSLSLNFAPPVGTTLTVVNNTGTDFIHGTFSNLAQGQAVVLSYGGVNYRFVANYYGGTGNDLVLLWASSAPVAWGANACGELGNNTVKPSPVIVAVNTSGALAGKTVIAVASGMFHSLALCADGTVAAWGRNSDGQLGNNGTTDSRVPVAVNTGALIGRTVIAVAAGNTHSLALCSDGTVAAWGPFQTLGIASGFGSPIPMVVDASGVLKGRNVIAISAGRDHSLALCSDGTMAIWGTAYGNVPTAVKASSVLQGRTVSAVSAGNSHDLALCADGTVVAWGRNSDGQLGNNSTTDSPVAVAVNAFGVLAGRTVIAISAGTSHSLALCSDGTVAAWGRNTDGELGNGSLVYSPVPVKVDSSGVLADKTVTFISAGFFHSLALCSDGTAAVWGRNDGGQLGNNSTASSPVPVAVSMISLAAGARFVTTSTGQSSGHRLGVIATPAQTGPIGSGTYAGLVQPLNGTSPGLETEGFFTATVQASGAFSAKLTLDGQTLGVVGALDDQGIARFGPDKVAFLTINRLPKPTLFIELKHDLLDDLTGAVLQQTRSSITAVSALRADRVFYNGKTPATTVPAAYLGKAGAPGVFNVILPWYPPLDTNGPTPQTPGLGVGDYPLGHGFGILKITAAGAVTFVGTLADGTAVTVSAPLAHHAAAPGNSFPMFAQLYSQGGFISANVLLDSTNPDSDLSVGTGYLHWARPASPSQYYPYGWPEVIVTGMLGAKYAATPGQSVLPDLPVPPMATAQGNSLVQLYDSVDYNGYGAYPINLSSTDAVTYPSVNPLVPGFSLSINRRTGMFTGTAPAANGTRPAYQGIIYQKGNWAAGWGFILSAMPKVKDYTGFATDVIISTYEP